LPIALVAPVNEPFSWPSRLTFLGNAAQLTCTNRSRVRLCSVNRPRDELLPTPLSGNQHGRVVDAARLMAAVTCFSRPLSPIIWWRTSTAFSVRFSSQALLLEDVLTVTSTRSVLSGLSMNRSRPSDRVGPA
jgi:hypothetical protein